MKKKKFKESEESVRLRQQMKMLGMEMPFWDAPLPSDVKTFRNKMLNNKANKQ